MPTGFEYCCEHCSHQWILFSKRFVLGPVAWGHTKFTCFSCQTFLSIAESIDTKSWNVWCVNHRETVDANEVTALLAQRIDQQVQLAKGMTPVLLHFNPVPCPTCREVMKTDPFGDHPMKCPNCQQYGGVFEGGEAITNYVVLPPKDSDAL